MPGLYGFDDNKLLKEVVGAEEMRDVQERVNTTERTLDDIKTKVDKTIYSAEMSESPDALKVKASSFEIYASEQQTFPYIDFHFNGSTTDYTSRIIEAQSGVLRAEGLFYGGQITNLNNAPLGFSIAPGSAANNPYSFFVTVLTVGGTAGKKDKYCQQIIYPWGYAHSKSFATRVLDNGQWTEWNYHTGNLEKYETISKPIKFIAGTWNHHEFEIHKPDGYRIKSVVAQSFDSHVVEQIMSCKFYGDSQLSINNYGGSSVTTTYNFYITYVRT